MTAPTEQEIRAIAERALISKGHTTVDGSDSPYANLRYAAESVADEFTAAAFNTLDASDEDFGPLDEPGDSSLYRDLRPSEAYRLRELVSAALDRAAERMAPILVDEVTAAIVAFATAHPDAPLRQREEVMA